MIRIVVAAIGLALIAGCSGAQNSGSVQVNGNTQSAYQPSDLGTTNYRAAEKLAYEARLSPGVGILTTTVVRLDTVSKSSNLGRLIQEQVGNRLVGLGYRIQEVRLAEGLVVMDGVGEVILSRDTQRLAFATNASVVVTGVYAPAGNVVHVSLRMVEAAGGTLLAGVDFVLPMTSEVRALLGHTPIVTAGKSYVLN